jgi:hypothetical protein
MFPIYKTNSSKSKIFFPELPHPSPATAHLTPHIKKQTAIHFWFLLILCHQYPNPLYYAIAVHEMF